MCANRSRSETPICIAEAESCINRTKISTGSELKFDNLRISLFITIPPENNVTHGGVIVNEVNKKMSGFP